MSSSRHGPVRLAAGHRPSLVREPDRPADPLLRRLADWTHHRFLWLLVGSYLVAAAAPGVGLYLRNLWRGEWLLLGQPVRVNLPAVLLAILLLNAGLGVQAEQLRRLITRPITLLLGLLGNLVVPTLFILGLAQLLRLWPNPVGVHSLIVGLALVASLPIAGSSAAWSRHANGDLALSLGLIVCSTCFSPVLTPAVLYVVGWAVDGTAAAEVRDLAVGGTSLFLVLFVLVPSLLGSSIRGVLGSTSGLTSGPGLKLLNSIILLLLSYLNAAVALPQAFHTPDWGFLAITTVTVLVLCTLNFGAGWLLGRSLRAGAAQETSLMFGLGMNNNGTGLVLASSALVHVPGAMLPLILYTLVQHLAAGTVEYLFQQTSPPSEQDLPNKPALAPVSPRRQAA
jgi:BASS family bile acid:Na+ symporter